MIKSRSTHIWISTPLCSQRSWSTFRSDIAHRADNQAEVAASGVLNLVSSGSDPAAASAGGFTAIFFACQDALGVEPWGVIALFGGLTRLMTLCFMFYGERASARMQLALPKLRESQERFNRVYRNKNASSLEVQLSASICKSERRRIFRQYQTSNFQCFASFLGTPLIAYGLYRISLLCSDTSLLVGISPFLWCTALSLPDPTLALPVVCVGLALLNFELSLRKELKTEWMTKIVWCARFSCPFFIVVISTFSTGVCLYFFGVSLVGLLQPILLRVPVFRRFLRFPS
ncbi:unnamed protein product [Phytomonas sp. EM1]|nr:unnamed protein product [Phytomonas sp. EM1]|eukprot:CCW61359.1 unnamed protein product [Phytomonas sp. isolate EM1]